MSIPDCPEEELWKFLDREDMKTLLESLKIDLEQFEEEQQDNGGYEKNDYEELSGYTGKGTELVLHSSIEDTVMNGVASLAFKAICT